jgi:hypothetical protein
MYVDTSFHLSVQLLAERLKRIRRQTYPPELRRHRLYLELIPPTISVATLPDCRSFGVTTGFKTLFVREHGDDLSTPTSTSCWPLVLSTCYWML